MGGHVWAQRKLAVLMLCLGITATACAGGSTPAQRADDGTAVHSPSQSAAGVRTLPRLVNDAYWLQRDGVRALVITPSATLRDSNDEEVFEEAWARVVAAIPDANTPGMRDQFICHATFASTKQGWYLEPARPAVGYWRTVLAGCNPGDVQDVG